MNVKKILLYNFMSHKDTKLDLFNDGIYSLVGENGAGKSAIRDAITWCLFGKSRVDGAGDDLIRDGEKEMYVVVELEHNGKNLQITRKRGRGKSTILQVEE